MLVYSGKQPRPKAVIIMDVKAYQIQRYYFCGFSGTFAINV